MTEWGDDPGRRGVMRLYCTNDDCDRIAWVCDYIILYGATEIMTPNCPDCSQPGRVEK